jgi:hypothetical protein
MDVKKTGGTPTPEDETEEIDEVDETDEVEEKGDTEPEKGKKEPETDTDVEDTKEETKKDEPRRIKVKYLKEEKELTEEEAVPYIQKGMNYDYVKAKADRADAAEAELAELKIKVTEQNMQKGKDALEKQLLKDGYDDEAVKKITATAFKEVQDTLEATKAESRKALALARVAVEKETMRKKVLLFDEVEPEIDKLMASNPNVSLATAYALKFGELGLSGKLEEMLAGKKKSAIAEYSDRAKRSGSITADNTTGDNVDINTVMDKRAIEATKAFKNDPNKVGRYMAKELKKKG